MIEIKEISTSDKKYYDYMEKLLIASFPPEEYRDLAELRNFTDNRSNFHNNVVFYDDVPVGLVTYWNFGYFFYIEHLAIDPEQRNGGYGYKLLAYLTDKFQMPIVLEVERPVEEMAVRRINFYKRQGYVLWERDYVQPPYRAGCERLPMYLMVHGNLDVNKDYETVKSRLYREVYNITG